MDPANGICLRHMGSIGLVSSHLRATHSTCQACALTDFKITGLTRGHAHGPHSARVNSSMLVELRLYGSLWFIPSEPLDRSSTAPGLASTLPPAPGSLSWVLPATLCIQAPPAPATAGSGLVHGATASVSAPHLTF